MFGRGASNRLQNEIDGRATQTFYASRAEYFHSWRGAESSGARRAQVKRLRALRPTSVLLPLQISAMQPAKKVRNAGAPMGRKISTLAASVNNLYIAWFNLGGKNEI
jgi:hypothetical protein